MLSKWEEVASVCMMNRHSLVCIYMYSNEHKQEGGGWWYTTKKARVHKKYGKNRALTYTILNSCLLFSGLNHIRLNDSFRRDSLREYVLEGS